MMEDLVKSLEGSFHVTKEINSTSSPHPRFSQYKQKSSCNDQESRRKQLLEIQKSNRLNYANLVRRLTEADWNNEEDEEYEEEDKESMDYEVSLRKPGRYYKDQLMLSEWLVEVPPDFKTEWLTVLCPIAKRCLVVASKARTRVYTKSGHCINEFQSGLPGGGYKYRPGGGTILDCLYSEAARTYYVLDLMCWNNLPVYDSETEFRFYWMHEKFKEHSSLGEISATNSYKFVPLPSFACVESDIAGAIEGASFEIDGLLFYHKRSHYIFGSTPLVVWLKPYMVPEILGLPVPDCQLQRKPSYYTNYADHMKLVEETKLKGLLNKNKNNATPAGRKRRDKRNKPRNVDMKDAEEDAGDEEESAESLMEAQTLQTGAGTTTTDHSIDCLASNTSKTKRDNKTAQQT